MRTVVVFAKEPEPGRVKTRFIPPCSPDEAARLYQAFVRDTIALTDRCRADRRVLAYVSSGEPNWLARQVPEGWRLFEQGKGDVGEKMHRAIARFLLDGPVVVIGSDLPTLPPERIDEAFSALRKCDVALGPSEDGGYYLVGARREVPEIFLGMTWSTETVFAETVERLRRHGISWHRLPVWYDMDTVQRIRRWLTERPNGADARHTRRAVAALPHHFAEAGRSR